MKTLNAPDTIYGKEGAITRRSRQKEELLLCDNRNERRAASRKIKAIGKRMTGQNTTAPNRSGSMTLYI